jgi:hypothetical protein
VHCVFNSALHLESWSGPRLESDPIIRRKIRLIESNAKCPFKLTFWQVCICLRPPILVGFRLGWSRNFLGSESGKKQSIKLLQNMVSNPTHHPPPPPPSHTLSVLFILYVELGREEVGGGEQERRLEGQ